MSKTLASGRRNVKNIIAMLHTVTIEKIIPGGMGLGRLADGLVVLTKHVIPGEKVLVRETKRRRGYLEAVPVEILEGSPDRIAPPCPYFGRCGGCSFQHIRDPAQLQIKNEILRESLTRAHILPDRDVLQNTLPSPRTSHYRYRIRLQVDPEGRIGFYQPGSRILVDISTCMVTTELINRTLQELTGSGLLREIGASLREIELLHSPADDRLTAVLRLKHGKEPAAGLFKEVHSSAGPDISLYLQKGKILSSVGEKTGHTILKHHFGGDTCGHPFSLSWSPGCFSQVNAAQNHQLIKLVCRLYLQTGGKKLLDLYCGMGNFSIPLGISGATVTGIEHSRESIRWARHNAQAAGLMEFSFSAGDVSKELGKLLRRSARFDVIVLDPPRQGLGRSTHLLADLEPQSILYISCDPATLARDLAILAARGVQPLLCHTC
jgi:23S rRNA (uracil1939-C5)-methyltransferase